MLAVFYPLQYLSLYLQHRTCYNIFKYRRWLDSDSQPCTVNPHSTHGSPLRGSTNLADSDVDALIQPDVHDSADETVEDSDSDSVESADNSLEIPLGT